MQQLCENIRATSAVSAYNKPGRIVVEWELPYRLGTMAGVQLDSGSGCRAFRDMLR